MADRYQREIEEILQQAGELGPGKARRGGQRGLLALMRMHIAQSIGGRTWSITPGRVMLVAVALLLSALIMTTSVPGIVGPLAWAGLLLFIVGYAMFFIRPNKVEKRWRGQPIDDRGERWWDRLWRTRR